MVDFVSRARKSINDLKTKSLIKKQDTPTLLCEYKELLKLTSRPS